MKFVLISTCLFLIATMGHCAAGERMNEGYFRRLLSNPPRNQEKLKAETLHGCVYIPAKGFVQRLVVGVEKTGESCSVTVNPDNTVEVSFLGDGVIPVVSTSTEGFVTDIFVAELGNDEVLIVQHHQGEVVSITQTIYDENGDVVYGRSGVGEFIRECNFAMTSSERSVGSKSCSK